MPVKNPKAKPINRKVAAARPTFTGKARPKYVSDGLNVFDAALNRLRWLFDEFDNKVSVSNSGGKDSTVLLELTAMVNAERGLPPLKVIWLDQECEFQATVDYQRYIMYERDDIDFHWYQIPFQLYNATNHADPWLNVWGEGEEWVRPREPDSIHVNDFVMRNGETPTRFKDVLSRINMRTGGAILTGMRCEESPSRRVFMTSKPMYKWITWGSEGWYDDETRSFPTYQMFHPLYDWSYRDIWKAIHDHNWRYNRMYDLQFQWGVPIRGMRVSNYHHVQSLATLSYLQEAEPETWEAATRRLSGINAHGHVGGGSSMIDGLPYMFTDWNDYLEHLITHLLPPERQADFRKLYRSTCKSLPHLDTDVIAQRLVPGLVSNDVGGKKIEAWVAAQRTKMKESK